MRLEAKRRFDDRRIRLLQGAQSLLEAELVGDPRDKVSSSSVFHFGLICFSTCGLFVCFVFTGAVCEVGACIIRATQITRRLS